MEEQIRGGTEGPASAEALRQFMGLKDNKEASVAGAEHGKGTAVTRPALAVTGKPVEGQGLSYISKESRWLLPWGKQPVHPRRAELQQEGGP